MSSIDIVNKWESYTRKRIDTFWAEFRFYKTRHTLKNISCMKLSLKLHTFISFSFLECIFFFQMLQTDFSN